MRPDNRTPEDDEKLEKLEQNFVELKPVTTYPPCAPATRPRVPRGEEIPRPIKYHTSFGVRVNGWFDKEKGTARKTSPMLASQRSI